MPLSIDTLVVGVLISLVLWIALEKGVELCDTSFVFISWTLVDLFAAIGMHCMGCKQISVPGLIFSNT